MLSDFDIKVFFKNFSTTPNPFVENYLLSRSVITSFLSSRMKSTFDEEKVVKEEF